MNYKFIITDHYKKALVQVQSIVTPELIRDIESLPCVESVRAGNNPCWTLQVERTSNVTTGHLAIQLRKFFKEYPISSNPEDILSTESGYWIIFN